MFIHCGHIWLVACEARDRAVGAVLRDPQAVPSDTMAAVVLSVAASEAFINELAEHCSIEATTGVRPISDELRTFANVLDEIEKSRGSLLLKYLMASQTLSGRAFDKGKAPYQDFSSLVSLRNDLMHFKPRDKFEIRGSPSPIEVPKYIQALQQRGLARVPKRGVGMSWFNILQTDRMSVWACETVRAMIVAVLDLIPIGVDPGEDLAEAFRWPFTEPGSRTNA